MRAGCASSKVTGKRLSEIEAPIAKLQIHITEADFGPARHQGVHAQERLMAILPQRVEALFAENGVENKTQFVSVKDRRQKLVQADEAFQYFLIISPSEVGFFTKGDNVSMEISAIVVDKVVRKSIWKGNIHFHKPTFAIVDADVADELVKALLVQLGKDEVLNVDVNRLSPKT